MRHGMSSIVLGLALAVGVAIGYLDSRPTWDDTGVTAAAVFLSAAALAAWQPRLAWRIGLAVGLPALVFGLVLQHSFGALAATGIALLGAGLGQVVGTTREPRR